jgi:hypothetical protein
VNTGIRGLSLAEKDLLSPGGIRTPHPSTRNLVAILTISRLPGSREGEREENERTQYVYAACRTCINAYEHWLKNIVNDAIRDTGGSSLL